MLYFHLFLSSQDVSGLDVCGFPVCGSYCDTYDVGVVELCLLVFEVGVVFGHVNHESWFFGCWSTCFEGVVCL